jgi:AcrR family transcriptional regulator
MTRKKAQLIDSPKSEIVQDAGQNMVRDGRNMRAVRNRRMVVEAFLELLEQGAAQPTAQMISQKAGVSTSTLFRLFEDLEAIHRAVLRSRFEQLKHLFVDVPSDLPLPERIKQLVELRSKFYEKVAPVREFVVTQRASSKYLAKGLEINEGLFYRQVRTLFAAELAALECREEILFGIDNLMSWESWHRLRSVQNLSVKKSKAVVGATLAQLLK